MKKSLFILGIISVIIISGCQKNIGPVVRTAYSMGTFIEITVYDQDVKKAENAAAKALKKIQELSGQLTIFSPESEISTANRNADNLPVKISPEVFKILKSAQYFSQISNGAFDITIGPLMKLWGFFEKNKRVPAPGEIGEALQRTGWKNIVLNEKNRTVFFKKEGVAVDFGGIAKGYAADLAAQIIRKTGIQSALINAGGNIYALGSPPGKSCWKIGVRKPRGSSFLGGGPLFAEIFLKDMACATSGDYENYFIKGGRRYTHIINPRTGYPAEGLISVTVLAPAGAATDALATAVFVLGKEKGAKLVESLPETYALIICEDKKDKNSPLESAIKYILTRGAEKYFHTR